MNLIPMKDIIVFVLFIINFYLKHIIKIRSGDDDEEKCCSICLEDISQDSVKTFECDHYFHLDCLNQWVSKSATCPICRTKLNVIHKIKINDTSYELLHN